MTNDREDDEQRRLISERAAEWFLRLEEWLSLGERRKYWRWLKKSEEHVAAVLDISHLSAQLRQMKLRPRAEDADVPSNIVDLYPQERRSSPKDQRSLRTRIQRAPLSWSVAAVLAVVAIAAPLTMVVRSTQRDQVVETDAGEWQTQTLDDGSTVKVGPLSRISVHFDEHQRSVSVPVGDAFFEVAKDASRPFIVSTKAGTARAVGTQFGVTQHDGKMTVTVLEGVVRVARAGGSPFGNAGADDKGSVTLSAGEQVDVSGRRLSYVRQVDVDSELAWIQGKFIFANRTVAEAVREFNRHNRLRIEVRDATVANHPVRGVFNVADPRRFAEFLAGAGLVRIVEAGEGVLWLEPVLTPGGAVAAPMQAEAE